MSSRRFYFAYGSNLSIAQMRFRCPQSVVVGPVVLHDHALAFGGYSAMWGGAVATIEPDPGNSVEGVLYLLTHKDLWRLDQYEGHPTTYRRFQVTVTKPDGRERPAYTYAQPLNIGAGPPTWKYFAQIAREYRRLGFDMTALGHALPGQWWAR